MNVPSLYHGVSQLVNEFELECRLRRVLKHFTLGVVASQSCQLGDIALALQPLGQPSSQERRLQRFLANPRVEMTALQQQWSRQVLRRMRAEQLLLLVDETALSDHLKIMVVGVWGVGGCVPLAWRCYAPTAYPAESQVRLIRDLLARIWPSIAVPTPVVLLADRGIGTSPDLIEAVTGLGADILFRVQATTRFRDVEGVEHSLRALGIRGETWQSVGDVFKKAGWLSLHATVHWQPNYEQPWCLVSSTPLPAGLYGCRFDHEVSFRDLKSDGFDWQRSHVWLPEHAERLLLVLALAYWLVLSLGQWLAPAARGQTSRWSAFRRGLSLLKRLFAPTIAPILPPPPLASPPFISCVVQ
jgi:hypothetical protein